jgi:isochorismate synthase
MIQQLRKHLAAVDLPEQLRALARNAPASAPISLCLKLGQQHQDWLNLLPSSDNFWYQSQPANGIFRLGIGHALQVSSLGPHRFSALDNAYQGFCQHWRHNGHALAFCGFAFDETNDTPLPNALLSIPAMLLENIDGHCTLTLSTTVARLPEAIADWQAQLSTAPDSPGGDIITQPPALLADRAWIARVNAALRDIKQGSISKLVLSRQCRIESSQPISPRQLLNQLIEQQPASLIYAYGKQQQFFLGATPERLVRLHGQNIQADALAGTAWSGSADLSAEKNCREQALVVEAVQKALLPFCTQPPNVSPVQHHPAGHLTHLRSEVSAQAHPATRLFDLVRALHPTPAVGGHPSAAALEWLRMHKEQRPGWYSGGIGTLDAAGNGEFSVALRSALVDGNKASLQAGAGIVSGSQAELELAETEAKFGTLLAALKSGSYPAKNGTHA